MLLIASGACPLHCRYCFRREFPYQSQLAARADWSRRIAELRDASDATEAILSGGDPLSLSNRRLRELFARIADTAVTTVRIHTRFPIAIPERVDDGLLRLLRGTRLNTVVVVHTNHANELDAGVERALAALEPALTALLNQSVLLRGVNDDAETLATLERAPVRLRRPALLPAPARPRSRRRTLRGRRDARQRADRGAAQPLARLSRAAARARDARGVK